MDIRTLQRVIIDALENIKAQDIQVFDTRHLTDLFDRVIIASGTSNRQTKALAASVRDAVKEAGGHLISTEGEETGEWVLVDCGDAVVHIMQPQLRQYYNLEELWGDKPVRIQLDRAAGLPRASEDDEPARANDANDEPAAPVKRRAASKPKLASARPARSSPPKSATLAAKKTARRPAAKTAAKTAARRASAKRAS